MWFDYDKDGRLDLLICNYVQWTPQGDVFCSADGKTKSYCTPEAYRGSTSWLYRNKGDGTFDDVTAKAGFFDVTSKSLGVTLLDYDQDGWPDVFVANDTQPNKLYRNNGNGTFTELGLKAGVAFSEEGRARAGMGVDAVDLDGSGRPTVAVTNFSGEMLGLFRAECRRPVRRSRARLGHRPGHAPDARLGLLLLRRRISTASRICSSSTDASTPRASPPAPRPASPPTRRTCSSTPAGASPTSRATPARRSRSRRWAAAPPSPTSTPTAISTPSITTNGGPVHLYRTDLPAGNRSVRLRLVGTASNRDGIGARATVRVGKASASRVVRTGSSYLSQSELPLTFGLGTAAKADEVTIVWPSGRRDVLGALDAGQEYTVTEGKGVTGKRATRR